MSDQFTMVIMDIYCSNHDCAGFYFLNISKLTVQSLSFSIHAQALPSFSLSNEQLVVNAFLLSNSHFRISPFHFMTYTKGNPHLANSKTLHISISHHWPEDDSYNRHIQTEFSNAKQNPEELMPKYLSRE